MNEAYMHLKGEVCTKNILYVKLLTFVDYCMGLCVWLVRFLFETDKLSDFNAEHYKYKWDKNNQNDFI